MPDIDDIFGVEDDDTPAPSGAKGNNPTAEMRKHIKELETELKKVKPEYDELKAFKAQYDSEQRDVQLKTVFTEVGVPEKAVKFYKLEFPEGDVSKETIAKWAVENGLAPEEGYSDSTNTAQGYVPTVHGDSFVPGAKRYSREEFEKALNEGPGAALAAQKALQEGRVDMIRAPK